MRYSRYLTIAAAVAVVASSVLNSAYAQTVAFKNVRVLPMDAERVLEDQTVVVKDGMIVAMGSADTVKTPRGAKVVKGRGRMLMPGLADMHGHVGLGEGDEAGPVARNLFLLSLANGVTLLRDPSGSPAHFSWRDKLDSGEWAGPEFYFTTTMHEGENAVWPQFAKIVTDPAEVDALVNDYKEQGYWGIKLYHTLSPEVYDAFITAGTKYDIKIVGHVPFSVGIDDALQARQYSIEHLRGYDFDGVPLANLEKDGGRSVERFSSWNRMSDARMDELVDKTVAAGVWNVPTFVVAKLLYEVEQRGALSEQEHFSLLHPILQGYADLAIYDEIFSPESREALKAAMPDMMRFVKKLNDAGGRLLIGTDTSLFYLKGFSPVDEIEDFVEAGLSPYDALRAATIGPAQSVGEGDRLGTIAVGKDAALILIDGDPLSNVEDLWKLHGVMARGHWYETSELEQMIRDDLAAAKGAAEQTPEE